MNKITQFFWGDVEIEFKDSRGISSPPRVVYGYVFSDIDEQWDRVSNLRRNHYHDIPTSQQNFYIHESDLQEIEPVDIGREPLIIRTGEITNERH